MLMCVLRNLRCFRKRAENHSPDVLRQPKKISRRLSPLSHNGVWCNLGPSPVLHFLSNLREAASITGRNVACAEEYFPSRLSSTAERDLFGTSPAFVLWRQSILGSSSLIPVQVSLESANARNRGYAAQTSALFTDDYPADIILKKAEDLSLDVLRTKSYLIGGYHRCGVTVLRVFYCLRPPHAPKRVWKNYAHN